MERLQHAIAWTVARKLEREKTLQTKAQCVYLIRCGQFYKIGIGNNPERRLMHMQIGNPHKLVLVSEWPVPDARDEERRCHDLLAPYHHRGEWFKLPKHVVHRLMGF